MYRIFKSVCLTLVLLFNAYFLQAQSKDSCLIVHYMMDGNAKDSSLYGNHATVKSATLTTDRFGTSNKAYYFNGSASLYAPLDTRPFKAMTVTAWIKTTYIGQQATIVQIVNPVLYTNRFTSGKFFSSFNGSTQDNYSSEEATSDVSDGKWAFVSAVCDGSTTKLYVNGVLESTFSESIYKSSGQLTVGLQSNNMWGFTGSIDEVRIYSCALSSTDINDIYDTEKLKPDLELTKVTIAKDTLCPDSFSSATIYLKNVGYSSIAQPRINFIIQSGKKITRSFTYGGTIAPNASIKYNVKLNLYQAGVTSITAYYSDALDGDKNNDTFKTKVVVIGTEAQFDVESDCIGIETVFSNKTTYTSGDTIEYLWDFGDGNTSTDVNPVHTYASIGTYKVILKAKSKYGCTDTTSHVINIFPLPVANFFTDTEICLGEVSNFSDSSKGASEWYWNFGGSSSSILQNPLRLYTEAGTYPVTLIVKNAYGCISIYTDTIQVYEVPKADFTVSNICVSDSLVITNESNGAAQYLWKFGDDSESFSENPSHKYMSAGSYKIQLFITNSNGCTDSVSHNVYVDSTCVWPGDANADKIVDNNDILAIGLAFGDTGVSRTDTSTAWKGNLAKDWANSFSNGENYKHADSDGDGQVSYSDTLAVGLNYSQTHDKNAKANRGKNTDPVLKLDIQNDSLEAGDTLVAYIILGENSLPAKDVYGLAFTVNYNTDLFSASEVDFSDCWLGNNLITFNNTASKSDFAITRTDHINNSGSGKIATLKLIVKQDVPRELNKALFEITENTIISSDGQIIPVNIENDSVPMIKTPNSINNIGAVLSEVKVYPNPSNGVYNIVYSSASVNEFDLAVYSINGKKLLTENSKDKSCTIDLSNYPGGIYLLKLSTQNSHHTVRLIKN